MTSPECEDDDEEETEEPPAAKPPADHPAWEQRDTVRRHARGAWRSHLPTL